jgi:hypothetical protein
MYVKAARFYILRSPRIALIELKDLTPYNKILLEKLNVSQLVKKSPYFMKSEASLPHSQKPVTYPYPEPEESSLRPPILLL